MKGDRVEVVVDTGHGTQTFEIAASRAGRRVEIVTSRGVVEVTEVTRGGTPVRTGRFMSSRVVALVEHPVLEADGARVDVETHRRMSPAPRGTTRGAGVPVRRAQAPPDPMALIEEERRAALDPDPADELRRLERGDPSASGER